MEAVQSFSDTEIMINQKSAMDVWHSDHKLDLAGTNREINYLLAEGGESYYNYVKSKGLIKDPGLIVLSSVHYYYFDSDDLKNTSTVINLKQLNMIKNLSLFLRSIFKIIPDNSNFIGCFKDKKSRNEFIVSTILSQHNNKSNVDPFENGISSRIPFLNSVYNMMDSKTDRDLTTRNVCFLLEKEGFTVLNVTEIKGLTYFHSQKISGNRINIAV